MPVSESQHTEWKVSWRDDFLRWICAFANSDGGCLEIGRNDKGEIVGLADASKLLEDLPNKIRDILGILVAVNLHHTDGKPGLQSKSIPIQIRSAIGATTTSVAAAHSRNSRVLRSTGSSCANRAAPGTVSPCRRSKLRTCPPRPFRNSGKWPPAVDASIPPTSACRTPR